jgi:hypothetical protein
VGAANEGVWSCWQGEKVQDEAEEPEVQEQSEGHEETNGGDMLPLWRRAAMRKPASIVRVRRGTATRFRVVARRRGLDS